MKNKFIPISFIAIVSLTGCITPAYYLSPFNTNANYYQAIPLHTDSVKSATYASAVLLLGGANHGWRDGISAFQGSIHRSNNLGHFQAFYGANFALGTYSAAQNDRYNYHYTSPSLIFPSFPVQDSVPYLLIPAANSFFGAYGFNGGINYVVTFKRGGEFRIGLETSIQQEFGDYLSFRKSLPDSAIDILQTGKSVKTLGGYLDFIALQNKGFTIGYKMAFGGSFVSKNTYLGNSNNTKPIYFSQTIHLAYKKFIYFGQLNLGTYSAGVQLGANYKLGKK